MDSNHCNQEELTPNVEPPTMTNTQRIQLDASHNIITEGIMATIDQGTNTESEVDTSLFRRKLQKDGQKFATADKFCQKTRLGSHKDVTRAKLLQNTK